MARPRTTAAEDVTTPAPAEGGMEPPAQRISDGVVVPPPAGEQLPAGQQPPVPATPEPILVAAPAGTEAAPAPIPESASAPPLTALAWAPMSGLVMIRRGEQVRQVHPVDVADWLSLGWCSVAGDQT